MKPGETIRYACGDCQAVFDLCVAPESEWDEGIPPEVDEADLPELDMTPTICPFCGSGELTMRQDRAVQSGP
jgi:hypothetical protein